jgi:hypothetical protein
MPAVPDIAGFRDAQRRLREALGRDAVFHVPLAVTWGADVSLDPQTGRPYDPTIVPESGGGSTDVTKRVGLVMRPITQRDDQVAEESPIGPRRDTLIAMAVEVEDFPDVQDATNVTLAGVGYTITETLRDPGLDDRYIVYAEAS